MKKKILCLVMTLVMTAGAATTAFARDYQGADGWQVTFDGSKMSSNFQDNDVTDEMANIQPGDSIELKENVMNSDSGSTDWYMTNEVIQTLEDAQQSAEGGGYSYRPLPSYTLTEVEGSIEDVNCRIGFTCAIPNMGTFRMEYTGRLIIKD